MTTISIIAVQILSTVIAAAGAYGISRVLQFFVSGFRNSKLCGPAVQRRPYGPEGWPILGTVVEHLRNWDRFHDWLCDYFEGYHTVTAAMQNGAVSYYTVDIENIKYILKTNFKNFPKVC